MLHQGTKPHLSWLFVAYFKDGSHILQTQEDKSTTSKSGSAFTDVMSNFDDLVAFELRHEDGDKVVTVDLVTGNFVVNGVPVCAHNQYFEAEKYPLKLVYFRENRVEQHQTATIQPDMSVQTEDVGTPTHYVNRYFIGWETTIMGKNKQVTLAVG